MHGLHFYIKFLFIITSEFTMQSQFIWLYAMIVYPLSHFYCVTLNTIQYMQYVAILDCKIPDFSQHNLTEVTTGFCRILATLY